MSLNWMVESGGDGLVASGRGRRAPRDVRWNVAVVLVALGCASSYEGTSAERAPTSEGRVASAVARLTDASDGSEPCVDEARACYGAGGACESEIAAFVTCSEDAGCGGWEGIELACAEVSCAASYDALADCYVAADACRALDTCFAASAVEGAPQEAPVDDAGDGASSAVCLDEATACYGPSAPCRDAYVAVLACSEAAGCGTESIGFDCLVAACSDALASFETCYFDEDACRALDVCGADDATPSEPSEPVDPTEPAPICEAEDAACTGEGSACASTVDALRSCARESGCEDEACLAQRCTELYADYALCTFSESVCRPAIDCRLEAGGPLDPCSEAAVACYFGGPCVEEYAAVYVREVGGITDDALVSALVACENVACPEVAAACDG